MQHYSHCGRKSTASSKDLLQVGKGPDLAGRRVLVRKKLQMREIVSEISFTLVPEKFMG